MTRGGAYRAFFEMRVDQEMWCTLTSDARRAVTQAAGLATFKNNFLEDAPVADESEIDVERKGSLTGNSPGWDRKQLRKRFFFPQVLLRCPSIDRSARANPAALGDRAGAGRVASHRSRHARTLPPAHERHPRRTFRHDTRTRPFARSKHRRCPTPRARSALASAPWTRRLVRNPC